MQKKTEEKEKRRKKKDGTNRTCVRDNALTPMGEHIKCKWSKHPNKRQIWSDWVKKAESS